MRKCHFLYVRSLPECHLIYILIMSFSPQLSAKVTSLVMRTRCVSDQTNVAVVMDILGQVVTQVSSSN